jgi:hypothetical protein
MNIGIIVLSQAGHTLEVARRLEAALKAAGHDPVIERLRLKGEFQPGRPFPGFEPLPALGRFAALVFAAPVIAFAAHPAMKRYLAGMDPLAGKPAALLVTQYFPFRWTGGNQAITWMRKACLARGAAVCGSGIVNWSRSDRERRIEDTVRRLSACFSG